ncbi:MAG: GNAT family N-acetyltransferase [Bacteroidales bacterium]|nr:GNAT family N-acetyltransferase [Bacteroidales bacterium]
MTYTIEQLSFEELGAFLRKQAEDCFPDLKDEQRLCLLAEKWSTYAECCTCRNNNCHLIGMIAFYANQTNEGICYIPHVYVDSDFRGQGLFSSMMRLIEEHIKRKNFKTIRLEVNKFNENAQLVYLHYGFSIVSNASEKTLFMEYKL